MAEQYTGRLLSSDSHIVEPADLWLTRMDKKWRDRAPRIEMPRRNRRLHRHRRSPSSTVSI